MQNSSYFTSCKWSMKSFFNIAMSYMEIWPKLASWKDMLNFEWTMNVSFPLSLVLSHLTPSPSLLPALFSPWIPTCNERAGSTNPGWRDIATLRIYYLKPVVQRPSLFSRAPRIRTRSWLSFFPISPTDRAVTDDVSPYCDEFFTVDICRAWRLYRRPSKALDIPK